MRISPAIPVEIRYKLEEVLVDNGYDIHGGGTCTDLSECDVSFSERTYTKSESNEHATKLPECKKWIGVDFDGTLCTLDLHALMTGTYGPRTVGEPIPIMVERVKNWVKNGENVKIFTARVSPITSRTLGVPASEMKELINVWCDKYLGFRLPITHEKDCYLKEIWDDLPMNQVLVNTGYRIHTHEPGINGAWAGARARGVYVDEIRRVESHD